MSTKAQKHADYLRAVCKTSGGAVNVNDIAEFIEKQEDTIITLSKRSEPAAIGYVYSYLCSIVDNGGDIRKVELPAIYESWNRDKNVIQIPPPVDNAFVAPGCELFA